MNKLDSVWNILAKMKGIRWILAVAAVGLLLLFVGTSLDTGAKQSAQSAADTEGYDFIRFYTESLEKRIEALCREVHGVNEAHVLLTLEGGSEYVYAANTSSSSHSYTILQQQQGETPVLVQEICPKIRGVAVVCTHGDDSAVRLAITELLSAALGISSANIRVAGS